MMGNEFIQSRRKLGGYCQRFFSKKAFNRAMVLSLLMGSALTLSAYADVPKPWELGFQEAATPMMEGITGMYSYLLIIIYIIGVFVSCLLGYVVYRFRASRHPNPTTVGHNTLLEIIWTAVPALIVVAIGIPSIRLLFKMDKPEHADMTIKAVGHQWYWSYEYPDIGVNFDSYMLEDKDRKPEDIRLLAVDHPIVVPVGKTVRVLVTSQDVLHSFAVPSFGIKLDAVSGRLNETWFRVAKEGTYYGQCSELCGVKHGFMPIAVKVVSQASYDQWVKEKAPPPPPPSTKVAPAKASVPSDAKKETVAAPSSHPQPASKPTVASAGKPEDKKQSAPSEHSEKPQSK